MRKLNVCTCVHIYIYTDEHSIFELLLPALSISQRGFFIRRGFSYLTGFTCYTMVFLLHRAELLDVGFSAYTMVSEFSGPLGLTLTSFS